MSARGKTPKTVSTAECILFPRRVLTARTVSHHDSSEQVYNRLHYSHYMHVTTNEVSLLVPRPPRPLNPGARTLWVPRCSPNSPCRNPAWGSQSQQVTGRAKVKNLFSTTICSSHFQSLFVGLQMVASHDAQ